MIYTIKVRNQNSVKNYHETKHEPNKNLICTQIYFQNAPSLHHSTCPSCPKRLGRVASSVGCSYGRLVGLLGRLVGMVGNVGNWTPDADKSLACRPLLAIAGDGWNKALATSASAFCMPTSSSTSWRDVKLDQNHAISWSPPRQSPVASCPASCL